MSDMLQTTDTRKTASLSLEQRLSWEENHRTIHALYEGEAAAKNGAGPQVCPYPWQPGRNTRHLRWLEGLSYTYDENAKLASSKVRCAAKLALRRAQSDAYAPFWATKLIRKIWP